MVLARFLGALAPLAILVTAQDNVGIIDPATIPLDIYGVPHQRHCESPVPRVRTCQAGEQPLFNEDSKIAIIGAGPAGMSMAHYLGKLGYKNVRIIERDDRVGGMSNTRYINGVPHEMGTCYTAGRYPCILRLLEEFFINRTPTPGVGFVKDPSLEDKIYPTLEWTMRAWAQLEGVQPDPDKYLELLREQLTRYAVLYTQYFGESGWLFPNQPKPEVMAQLTKQTFRQFLENNNMKALVGLMVVMQSSNGFGFIDEVPAYYGFMWSTPTIFLSIIAPNANNTVSMLRDGWGQLWKRMARGKDIVFNSNITEVNRNSQKVQIKYQVKGEPTPRSEIYDFLMVSSKWPDTFKFIKGRADEVDILGRPKSAKFHAVLFEADDIPRNYQLLFADKLVRSVKEKPHLCYYRRDLGNLFPNLTEPRDIYVGGQQVGFGLDNGISDDVLDRQFYDDLDKLGAKNARVIERFSPPYFPRFSQKELLQGYPWKLWDMQGKYRTWYIGSVAAGLESTADVIDYNYRLLQRRLCKRGSAEQARTGY
eukprot:comp11579_c0_seq1/m.6052 comp11579_c0_seq1/g.6052  ORF comp11579_c0_seq1/g.6052 comp11579_c0_seq1/m.6052 type:complete len:535 (-) comp11579_c0_seq1:398-2002(-)